jgi:hypothetical protein
LKPKTKPLGSKTTRPGVDAAGPQGSRIVETFLAYLPLSIYAHKLRGFIDDLGAEMISCTEEKTVMSLCSRNWWGMRSKNGLTLQVDACCRTPNSGYRVVEAMVWPTGPAVMSDEELSKRARMLIRLLRGYLMAASKENGVRLTPELRQELIGK